MAHCPLTPWHGDIGRGPRHRYRDQMQAAVSGGTADGVPASRTRRAAPGMLTLTAPKPSQAVGRTGGSWPTARGRGIVSGARADTPAGELEASTLHAYPEVVRTGYEMADHMVGNRTGLPMLGVETLRRIRDHRGLTRAQEFLLQFGY